MKTFLIKLFLALPLALICSESIGGFASSENFLVSAPDQELAEAVLARAEEYRREVAIRWLGSELPSGTGRAIVSARISQTSQYCRFWSARDTGGKLHTITVTDQRGQVSGYVLRHEITHLVLDTGFDGRLPPWASEGIAMLEDGQSLKSERARVLAGYARTRSWPNLRIILRTPRFHLNDSEAFITAFSFTQYLLSRRDPSTYFKFAVATNTNEWESAAHQHYGTSVEQLQEAWQTRVTRTHLRHLPANLNPTADMRKAGSSATVSRDPYSIHSTAKTGLKAVLTRL